jgi:hypothetical protein
VGFLPSSTASRVPERAWRLKKARELVKLLALAPGHRLHREQVDGRPVARPRAARRRTTSTRRCTSRGARSTRTRSRFGTSALARSRTSTSTGSSSRGGCAPHGTLAAYRAALAIYGGELLPENRYDDWAAAGGRARRARRELAESSPRSVRADGRAGSRRRELVRRPRARAHRARRAARPHPPADALRNRRAGKTRLALELARAAEASYDGGAALVTLAELADARLVPDAVASAFDVRALPGQDVVDALVDFLVPRTLLLVVDNCEHVLGASAALVDALLRSARG